ncbi:hypothetical protein E2C01_051015 [Portunus trituberculatus]|uniref:Uncharacterized protein n=1 Tax=Portunus trituberculatus TaxID=210409 RepID=A0A5B7GKM9_PORTR|nr:hypothetical protein [Portunus trituberculatus]
MEWWEGNSRPIRKVSLGGVEPRGLTRLGDDGAVSRSQLSHRPFRGSARDSAEAGSPPEYYFVLQHSATAGLWGRVRSLA